VKSLRGRTAGALGVVALLLAGCGGEEPVETAAQSPTATSSSAEQLTGELTVLAAASLTETFTQLADEFERKHPDVTVTVSFGASSALAQQILAGAPADVFASAAPAPMQQLVDTNAVAGEPQVFASNVLQITVPAGNPGGVTQLADFADPGRTIALCAPEVPCGSAAEKAFAAAGVAPAPDTLEQDVRATLTKVQLGEVDAALVYRTDVLAAGDTVEGLDFRESAQAVNDYPIAALKAAQNPSAAQAFVSLVLSTDAAMVFSEAGFQTP
jgi:molybdate transport system substrate-binding protein